ncbi:MULTISPECIES: MarR family winged helix-turn-helix transcriptional regulator [unclassified Streptomyces]|uniref:MarR family winged helix-turn-helix transcriptional regulator n=1 Tax=unclassified Streptomyces TaxID=2593676 RepID=UPI0011CE43F3|nr:MULTISPECIES: MarR family transcriptional regulator [unclassified Streptomyces]TXS79310.1 MarR family transcriptional regulator [Streptomyces sp. me109]
MPPPNHPPQPLRANEEAVLRALGRMLVSLPRLIDADMVHDGQLPLSEYRPLMCLSEAPDRRMRMSDLAAACTISLSGMTRLVTRLERRGLVQRVRCDEDARGCNAVLTDFGLDCVRQAWPTHLASVRRHIFDHLDHREVDELGATLRKVTP